VAAAAGAVAAALAVGCKEKPPQTQYVDSAGSSPAEGAPAAPSDPASTVPAPPAGSSSVSADGAVTVAGITLTPPDGWAAQPPSRSMRAAQYDAGGVEVVVFYFGPGQGGTAEQNLARWASQVLGEDGAPAEPSTGHVDVGSLHISTIESTGVYQSGMPGAAPTPLEGTTLIGAVIEGAPGGSVFVRAVGPAGAVAPQRDAILAFVRSAAPAP